MNNMYYGKIKFYNEELRMLTIEFRKRVHYFYLQKSLHNHIGQYLAPGRFIVLSANTAFRNYKGYKVHTVEYVERVQFNRYRKNIVFYDRKLIKKGTKELINSLDCKMFLDLEMSMHPYHKKPNFKQEIIQVGYLLVDKNEQIIEQYNQIIRPTLYPKLSKRTTKFLSITQEDIDQGISFSAFYEHFKQVLMQYKPSIIVWGKNDILALRDAYRINKLPSLHKYSRFINLLKLHKTYFNLKNDLGLFTALNLYLGTAVSQDHDAMIDAQVTRKIFQGFKAVVNYEKTIDIGNNK